MGLKEKLIESIKNLPKNIEKEIELNHMRRELIENEYNKMKEKKEKTSSESKK